MKKSIVAFVLAAVAAYASACPVGKQTMNGTWNGWNGTTLFMLFTGQVFQQTEYRYHYEYAFNPQVLIFIHNGQCKAKIGSAPPVGVQQLR